MKKYIVIVSVVIVLAAAGGAVWYTRGYQRNQNPSTTNDAQTTEATATTALEVITSDVDTSDWQTYRNEDLGVSFKYPADWGFYEDEDTGDWQYYDGEAKLDILKLVEVKNMNKNQEPGCGSGAYELPPGTSVSFSVSNNTKNYTFETLQQECIKNSDAGSCDSAIKDINQSSTLITTDAGILCGWYPNAQIIKNGKIYSLSALWSGNPNTNVTPDKIFYAILNSLEIK
jgi:hypothetical protein